MHREVFALLYNDNKDAPPLLSTDTGAGYIQVKARLGMKKVRKWEWSPFTNPARSDKAVFHHWRRATDEPREYPFAKFNKVLSIPTYSPNEYNLHLKTSQVKWSKAQTDHLFELANRFDLRFVIMADRWDRANYGTKTVEDLKERYYEVINLLQKVSTPTAAATPATPTDKNKTFVFDAEHERKRKEQLRKLFDRSSKQIEEEQMLLNELKKIEARKKERDRKTQDLQKLISQADQVCGWGIVVFLWNPLSLHMDFFQQGEVPQTPNTTRKQDKKLNKKKIQSQVRPSRVDSVVSVSIVLDLISKVISSKESIIFHRRSKVPESNSTNCVEPEFHCDRKR